MSVRKRGAKWIVDIDFEFPDGTRKRIRKVSPVQTKRGAEQFEREIRFKLAEGNSETEKEVIPTFQEFAVEFMEDYAEVNNKLGEIKAKRLHLNMHLIPAFGSKRLDEITQKDIEHYKRKKQKAGLNPKTINNHLTTLNRMFTIASEWEILERGPKIRKLKCPEPEFDFLTFGEAERLIDSANGQWKTMITVALKCGLRQGELLGLFWDDINFERKLLQVKRSIDRHGNVGTPKSGKSRVVPLNDDVLQSLKEHKHHRGMFVFCDENGAPLRDNKCKWPLIQARRNAGLRHITWHVLRHTFASHLVMRGASLAIVQELLGHSTIQMTMRYAHLSPEAKHEAVQLLNSSGTIAAQNEVVSCKLLNL